MTKIIAFSNLWELDDKQSLDFVNFKALNEIINSKNVTYNELLDSYCRVLLSIAEDSITWFSELDLQIKYLMDVVREPINKILRYADKKYENLEVLLKEALFDFVPDHYINSILNVKKWDLEITVVDKYWVKQKVFKIPFCLTWDMSSIYIYLKEFEKEISKLKIELIEILQKWGNSYSISISKTN